MWRALPLLICLALSACTAELKEENNTLTAQRRRLQGELVSSETKRGELQLQLEDAHTRLVRLEAASKYGFDLKEHLWARLETSMGEIVCELHPGEAPQTVDSFVRLAEGRKEWFDPQAREMVARPLYDGTPIFRTVAGQLFQTGSPTGKSDYAPGWTLPDEIHPDRPMIAGALAMANRGTNSSGVQFFITARALPELEGKHTVFGTCEPLDVVRDLAGVPTDPDDPERPVDPPILRHVVITHGDRPAPGASP